MTADDIIQHKLEGPFRTMAVRVRTVERRCAYCNKKTRRWVMRHGTPYPAMRKVAAGWVCNACLVDPAKVPTIILGG